MSYDCCTGGEHCCDGKCVKITSINGPNKVCLGRSATFTAKGSNGNTPCFVKWEATDGHGNTYKIGNGSSFTNVWLGPYIDYTDWGTSVIVRACNCNPCSSCPKVTKSVTIGFWTFSSYSQIANCSDVMQHPTKPKEENGCSVPWYGAMAGELFTKCPFVTSDNPTGCTGVDFTNPACDNHDTCYQTCSFSGGANKATCDANFCAQLNDICSVSGGDCDLCSACSKAYCDGVVMFGQSAYEGVQKEYCVCCEQPGT